MSKRVLLKAALIQEKAAWKRYKDYCSARCWGNRSPDVRDQISLALYGAWQVLYEVRRSLTGARFKARRPYKKGGLNL